MKLTDVDWDEMNVPALENQLLATAASAASKATAKEILMTVVDLTFWSRC